MVGRSPCVKCSSCPACSAPRTGLRGGGPSEVGEREIIRLRFRVTHKTADRRGFARSRETASEVHSARSRTLNSSFQRCLPSRLMHHSSSVPTSVTLLCRCTGTVRPSLPGASSVVASGLSSSIWPSHSSTMVPTASLRRTDGAEEAELGRLADDQAELLAGHVGLGPFLHAEGHDAQRLDRRRTAGHGGQRRLRRRCSTRGPCRRECGRPCRAAPGRSRRRRAATARSRSLPCSTLTGGRRLPWPIRSGWPPAARAAARP